MKNDIPALLPSGQGTQAEIRELWQNQRRSELLALLEELEYGGLPQNLSAVPGDVEAFRWADSYVMQRLNLCCGDLRFHLEAYIPKGVANCPTVLYLLLHGEDPSSLPIRQFLKAGCAFAFLNCEEVAEDSPSARKTGLFASLRYADAEGVTAGALAAWAWGLKEARNCLAMHTALDANRIALVGYSRGGKAALWSCARYGGFALCVAVHSGCGGASLYRTIPTGLERLGDIVQAFPAWFAPALERYAGCENKLPFDQHMLLALCAPCNLLILDADEDPYCSAASDKTSVELARPVFELCGGTVTHHIGHGNHTFRRDEWDLILEYVCSLP